MLNEGSFCVLFLTYVYAGANNLDLAANQEQLGLDCKNIVHMYVHKYLATSVYRGIYQPEHINLIS